MERKRYVTLIFLILSVAWSCVIWNFSLRDAEKSESDSGFVVQIVENALGAISGKDVSIKATIVRKAAHFTEFALLGVLVFLTVHGFNVRKRTKLIAICGLWAFSVASIDETIQLFSAGRSAQVSDVMLDFSGSLTAILLCVLIFNLMNKHKIAREEQG